MSIPDKKDKPIQVQRTMRKKGNIIRLKTDEGMNEYNELTIGIEGSEISYIPYEAFKALLKAYEEGRPILNYRLIFLGEDKI